MLNIFFNIIDHFYKGQIKIIKKRLVTILFIGWIITIQENLIKMILKRIKILSLIKGFKINKISIYLYSEKKKKHQNK